MRKAGGLAESRLLDFLCRPSEESDREAVLQAVLQRAYCTSGA